MSTIDVDRRKPRPPRRGVLWTGLLVFGLIFSLGMIALAFFFLLDLRSYAQAAEAIRGHERSCQGSRRPIASADGGAPAIEPEDTPSNNRTQWLPNGVRLPLSISLSNVTSKGGEQFVPLSRAIPAGHVTVVNLWAPSCGPCKSEMPRLQRVLAGADARVQFLPIVLDNEPADVESFRPKLPPFRFFLTDYKTSDNLAEALGAKGLYQKKMPVTFLVGCRQTVRWLHFGELTEGDVPEFEASLKKLVEEIGPSGCGGRRDGRAATRPHWCGDGTCDIDEGRDGCCLDCCPGNDGTCDKGENPESEDCKKAARGADAGPQPTSAPKSSATRPPQRNYPNVSVEDP